MTQPKVWRNTIVKENELISLRKEVTRLTGLRRSEQVRADDRIEQIQKEHANMQLQKNWFKNRAENLENMLLEMWFEWRRDRLAARGMLEGGR